MKQQQTEDDEQRYLCFEMILWPSQPIPELRQYHYNHRDGTTTQEPVADLSPVRGTQIGQGDLQRGRFNPQRIVPVTRSGYEHEIRETPYRAKTNSTHRTGDILVSQQRTSPVGKLKLPVRSGVRDLAAESTQSDRCLELA
jgi:hypothetical protein